MANLSDAFGDVIVENVGKEFIEFLNEVQGGDEVYYKLFELDQFKDAKPNENGDISFSFSTMGRWAYENNINGYLGGEWMQDPEQKEAYDRFINALKKKGGLVDISYTDSDAAMDWMGTGEARLSAENGVISFGVNFNEEAMSISGYADLCGEDEYWALEYLKGDEVAEEYSKYEEKCEKKGESAVSPSEWYDTLYEGEY